jgi:Flp pilus assembly protein TadG
MTWTGFLRLSVERRGAAAVEFALIAPFLLLGLMGVFDLGYNMYTSALLEGAIQKAARDSGIEGAAGETPTLDARVTTMVRTLAPGSTMSFARTAYTNFSDVGEPEDFTDVNGDGVCNDGEPFEDSNGNGSWDSDRGEVGLGSARDSVLYEVTVTYPKPFPLWKMLGQSSDFTMVSKTVLRNQPYSLQQARNAIGSCA